MESTEEICIISSDGQKFVSCREELSSNSDFFTALFNSGMKECHQKNITLSGLPSSGLKWAFQFIKEKAICCPLESMHDVLEVCTYLQMEELTEYCSQTIKQNISSSNWFLAYEYSEDFNLDQLKQNLLTYFASNFSKISKMDDLYDLPLESVTELLEGPICGDKEVEVFRVAYLWLKKNDSFCNTTTVDTLLSCVRFTLMTEGELNRCMDELHSANIEESSRIFANIRIAKDILSNPLLLCKMDLGKHAMPRLMKSCVLSLGGFTKSISCTNRLMISTVDNVCDTDSDLLTWKCHAPAKDSPKLPTPLCEHSVAVVCGFLYVAGGQSPYCWDGRHTRTNVYRLDTRLNKWCEVSSMNTQRSLFFLGTVNNCLYAVGGNIRPRTATSTVERYDIFEDQWEYVCGLEMGVNEHSGCSYNGHLYISGGYKGSHIGHLNRVWSYNPENDDWTERSPIQQARSYHSMVAIGEHIFVFGGVKYIGDDVFEDIKACEMYSPATDQWSTISPIPRFASCMGHCVIENKVFIFGGYSFEDHTHHQFVQIYDTSTGKWTEKLMNNKNINFFPCTVLELSGTLISSFNR